MPHLHYTCIESRVFTFSILDDRWQLASLCLLYCTELFRFLRCHRYGDYSFVVQVIAQYKSTSHCTLPLLGGFFARSGFLYSLSVSVVPFTEYVAIKLVPVSVRDETPSIHTNTNTIRIPTRADCLQFFSSQTT